MPIGTALAIGLGIAGAAGSIGGAAIGAHAAGRAAGAQASAAEYAAQLQHQDAQAALDFQRQVFGTQQANFAPWLQTGTSSLANLANLLGVLPPAGASSASPTSIPSAAGPGPGAGATPGGYVPVQRFAEGGPVSDLVPAFRPAPWATAPDMPPIPARPELSSLVNPALGAPGSLMQGWDKTFQAPTNVTEQNDPGYQFRLQEGLRALQNSAAARGGLLAGGTAKALENYAQDYASNEYSNVYNRALTEYQQGYNIFQQNQANRFNRLAALSGMGQTAAGQLSSAGQAAAGNVGNILLTSGQQIGNALQNAAFQRGSGYVNAANAWGGALTGGMNNINQLLLLSQLGNLGIPTLSSAPGPTGTGG